MKSSTTAVTFTDIKVQIFNSINLILIFWVVQFRQS